MVDSDTRTELNRLYWETESSVSQIAETLDVSRRALYDGILPRPAGRPCPECGAELVFRNRTALENGEAECLECGLEKEVDPDEPEERVRPRTVPYAGTGPVLGTAFLAGLLVGVTGAFLLRR